MAAMKVKARMVRQMLHLLEPHENRQIQVCHHPLHSGLSCLRLATGLFLLFVSSLPPFLF